MTVLLLRLAGPMQSWGSESRFSRRTTDLQPTKSGVLGLLAAARGSRRTDPLEDLLDLRLGVRIDQPGTLQRDFQTARSLDGRQSMPLTYRFYLADAAFVAAVEGDPALLEGLDTALRAPTFPLYLGRRSCPPAGPVSLGLRDGDLEQVLCAEPWHASPAVRRRNPVAAVHLQLVLDAPTDVVPDRMVRDVPLSFDPELRSYGLRGIVRTAIPVHNPDAADEPADDHDPMSILGGN